MSISARVEDIQANKDSRWAWNNYLTVVRELIEEADAKRILEIGGGRRPSFSKEQVDEMGLHYTSNDISQRELDIAPEWVAKACFDVQSPDASVIEPFAGQYDFVYSKMVMEHVASFDRAYRNIHTILAPGGMTIAHHPLLYALPFVVNKLIPEAASDKLLRAVFPGRTDKGTPKFPAYYDGCVISDRVKDRLKSIGFTQVWQVPFYGHGYYAKFPVLRDIHKTATRFIASRDIDKLAAYSYTIALK